MTIRSRTLSLAGATAVAGVLFVAGTVAAGAENPPATLPVDAGTTTVVASDPAPASTDTGTTDPAPTTTAAPAPTTTAPDPAPTTTAPAPAPPTTTTAPPPPTPTTSAPRFDPWAALLAWLAAHAPARHGHPAPSPTAPVPTTPAAPDTSSAASASSTRSSSSSDSSSSLSSSSTASAPAAVAAPAVVQVAQPAPAHLTIAGSATTGEITVGSTVTYAFTVTNSGGRATTASFNDTLPVDVAPIAADADQGTCSSGQSVSCSLGSIAPGQTVTVTVVVQVARATAFQNTISLTAGDPGVKVDSAGGPLRLQAAAAAPVKLPVATAKKAASRKTTAARKKTAAKKKPAAKKPKKG